MGAPKKEHKPEPKILSWRVDKELFDLFNQVHIAGKKKTKVDTIEAMIKKEAKRLKIQ